MADREHFWRLEHLSNRQLLESLQGALRTQRCSLAEIVAHLGEVEERRLHLAAAHGSMFSYCVQHLGMSEDEACRRIDLARLARRFPLLFGELASGRISLSVALLLKPVLTPDNCAELIAALRGTSLRTARELLAAHFPRPDVPSRIRKLPERSVAHTIPATVGDIVTTMPAHLATAPSAVAHVADAIPLPAGGVDDVDARSIPAAVTERAGAIQEPVADASPARVTLPNVTTGAATAAALISSPQLRRPPELELGPIERVDSESLLHARGGPSQPLGRAGCAPPRPAQRLEPLSAGRYRIQFTADAGLKQKLELARDLLRHANPSGDLAPIVSRALELLLQELLRQRFGASRQDPPRRSARPASHAATAPAGTLLSVPDPERQVAAPPVAPSRATTPTSHIPRAARRAVLERDGLGCCWVNAEGNRCGSTAWLQVDHRHPSGKGGSSAPENLRLLCRAHNRFAAECAYGRDHIERAIQARQRSAKRHTNANDRPHPRRHALD